MIVITGTPGTGKTSVSKVLGKALKMKVLHVGDLVKEKNHLCCGEEGGSLLVDVEKLREELEGFDGIAEGHVLCEISLPARAIVLRTNPIELEARLRKRDYSESKIRENVEAEAIDYCWINASQNYEDLIQVDTTGLSVEATKAKILFMLDGLESDSVDWSEFFLS